MGTEDFHRFFDKDQTVRACADMLIVATPEFLAAIEPASAQSDFPGLMTHACGSADPVPEALLAKAQVLVIEVDPISSRSLERLKQLAHAHPDLPKIAAIGNATVALTRTLVREGISDVVSLPFQLDELLEISVNALLAARERRAGAVKLAPQVAVIRSVGASGATTFATHLAGALAADPALPRPVALVDFDLQSGMIADYLGAAGTGSLADLFVAGDRLDEDLLRSVARQVDGHVAVFAAPTEIQPIESIDTDRALQLLMLIRQSYSAAVIDLPADWTNWALSVVSASDLIVLMVELSVNSLRQAKRRLELFANVGIEPDKVVLVVNRVEKRMFRAIDLSDVTDTLKHEIIGSLALEGAELPSAQAQGLLVDHVARKSKYAADVHAIAELVAARLKIGGE